MSNTRQAVLVFYGGSAELAAGKKRVVEVLNALKQSAMGHECTGTCVTLWT